MDLSDTGIFSYFPDDFVEQPEEHDAIIMAQANKGRQNKNNNNYASQIK
ncbi:MAG: hypothetical protein LBR26_05875 [Prevotella sp.]|nr:hypothetical protein [Prevotella sp.]